MDSQHPTAEVKTRIGVLSVTILPMKLDHLPRFGMFIVNDMTVKILPTDDLHQINHVLEPLIAEFEGLKVDIDDIIRAIKIANRYRNHAVSVHHSRLFGPGNPLNDSSYDISPYINLSRLDIYVRDVCQSDKSLEENAELLAKAIRDHQVNEAIAKLQLED